MALPYLQMFNAEKNPFQKREDWSGHHSIWGFRSKDELREIRVTIDALEAHIFTGHIQAQPMYPQKDAEAAYGLIIFTNHFEENVVDFNNTPSDETVREFLRKAQVNMYDGVIGPVDWSLSGYGNLMYRENINDMPSFVRIHVGPMNILNGSSVDELVGKIYHAFGFTEQDFRNGEPMYFMM